MHIRLFQIFIALSAVTARAAPLTLDDAIRIFRISGFDLLIANANLDSARTDEQIAAALPNPSFSLSRGSTSNYDPTLCSGCSSHSVSAGVTDSAISDLVSGRRRLRTDVAHALVRVSAATRDDVERTLEFSVKQQLLQAELAKKSLDFARQAHALAAETFDLISKRYNAGAVSEADVARADVQRLESEQAMDSATQALDVAKSQLAFLLGVSEPIEVADDLVQPSSVAVGRDEIYRDAIEHRPDLTAARLQIERARSGIELAKRQRVPDFSPSVQYSREGSGQSAIQPPTLTLGVTTALPILYRYRGEVAKAEAELRTQEIAKQKIEAQVSADVSASFAAFQSARARVERMQSRLLPQAARARDLVRLQYEKGAASLFEFLDAQRTYLAAQNEYLQTLNDDWTAVFQMEQASGVEFHR
jgi:outer membrane protein, heavy metal efflux system